MNQTLTTIYTETLGIFPAAQEAVTEFRGEFFFLSNFYYAPITYRGQRYANNEAAFQAQKTRNLRKQKEFTIENLQHPDLREKLLQTCCCPLFEGNTWGDRYWGTVNGYGENHLGIILMDIRAKLRQEI